MLELNLLSPQNRKWVPHAAHMTVYTDCTFNQNGVGSTNSLPVKGSNEYMVCTINLKYIINLFCKT